MTWVPSTAHFLVDEDDHDRVLLALSRIRAEVLAWVGGHVESARAAAIMRLTSLLAKANEIEERMMAGASMAGSHPYRIIQLLYALLLRNGPLDFGLPPPAEVPSFFANDAYTVLGDVVALSNELTRGRRGLHRLRIADRTLIAERSKEDLDVFELLQNLAVERGGAWQGINVLDAASTDAQRAVAGVSIDDLFAFIDPARPDSGLAGTEEGDLCLVDLERSRPAAVRVVSAYTLTANRLRRFAAPFFFDLGPMADPPRSDEAMVEEAADVMWLAYYPYLEGLTARRPGAPMAFTTYHLMTQALATAETSQAHLYHRLEQQGRTTGAPGSVAVAELARRVHADLEKRIGESLRAAGLSARVGITNDGRRPLPCGEIDVLAAGVGAEGRRVVVVCEAKNVDLALQKDAGYENLASTMKRAREQVARKAAWVAGAWSDAAALLGLPAGEPPTVLGLIVTRRPTPLGMLAPWPGAVPQEIENVAAHLLQRSPAMWRADLARGIVPVRAGAAT